MGSFRAGSIRQCLVISLLLSYTVSCLMGGYHAQGQQPRPAPRGIADSFNKWTTQNINFSQDGKAVQLILDPLSASGIGSKGMYLFGGFGAWMKLPANDSSGTVTTLYMASAGPRHSEFDFEFLGNQSGQPFLLHTNIFVDGVGKREQQIYLGFDPSAAFHFYHVQWNKDLVVFYVDDTPIRMFKNLVGTVPNFVYPNIKPMGLYASIWDGSDWATQGGRVKLNWTNAPFVATYRHFRFNGCAVNALDQDAVTSCQNSWYAAPGASAQKLGIGRIRQMRRVKATQVHYNYCDDRKRYPVAPPECAHNTL